MVKRMSAIIKRGSRLLLRETSPDDTQQIYELYNDPAVTNSLSFDSRTYEEIEALTLTASEATGDNSRDVYFLIAELLDGTFIGVVRLAIDTEPADLEQSIDPPHSAQLGGALTSKHWRNGYGAEAARLLMEIGFNDRELHRLWGARGPENISSKNLMEHLGMKEEARIHDHVFTNGAWRDSIVHAILRDEFQNSNSK